MTATFSQLRLPELRSPFLRFTLPPAALLLGCLAFAGCGGGGGGGAPPSHVDNLETSLNRLGVDTTKTARQVAAGVEVPTTYTPLGAAPALSKTDELLLFGTGLTTPALTNPAVVLELTGANGAATADVLHAENAGAMPWAAEQKASQSQYQSLRAPVAADIDGDGLDETVIVHQNGIEVRTFVIDDETAGFATRDLLIANLTNVTCVTAADGDLDGDGDDELIVGTTRNGDGEAQVYRYDGTTFVAVGPVHRYGPSLPNSVLHLELATGNIDLDPAMELVVGIEETRSDTGAARFAVLDDLGTGLATLREGAFSGRDQQNALRIGITVGVAIGDIDGDNVGEVLLGGVTGFVGGGTCQPVDCFLLALDDRLHGLADIAGRSFSYTWQNCDSPSNPRVRTVFLHALDLDGDGRAEIQANQFVFQDFVEAAPWTEVAAWRLPQNEIWESVGFGWFARNTATMVTGDFTGDDRDDIAVYHEDSSFVDVFALGATATAIQRVRHIAVPFQNSQTPRNPVILPVNVDTDSKVLKYSDADYQLVFTEPIVLAALAAPPAAQGIGQNVDACFTAFGNTSTTITERERSLSFSAAVTAGVNIDGGALTQSEFEMKATLTVEGTRTVGTAYELSKTIVFTSAPTEDTIVFTCVPVDRYTYTVVSHPDPTMVGQKVVVDLPRSPITLQAERGFYNRTIPDRAMHIDNRVFQHTIGDLRSYPTAAQKAAILASGGLQVGPQSVGQGGGSTEVTLEVGNAVSHGGSLEVGFEVDLEVTAGSVLAGITIGSSVEMSWKVTSGTSTTYTGVVGAIDAAHFAEHRYLFGLFTYVQRDPETGREFQVLNYWVE